MDPKNKLTLFNFQKNDSIGFSDISRSFVVIEKAQIKNISSDIIFNNDSMSNLKAPHCTKVDLVPCNLQVQCIKRYVYDCRRYRLPGT